MRRRAFRPEVVGCLEERALLSGIGGGVAAPVVLPRLRLITVYEHMNQGFLLLHMNRVALPHLHEELRDVAVMIPYGKVDGLGARLRGIVDRLGEDLAARVPNAIRAARNEALNATRAEVEARVRSGDVIIR